MAGRRTAAAPDRTLELDGEEIVLADGPHGEAEPSEVVLVEEPGDQGTERKPGDGDRAPKGGKGDTKVALRSERVRRRSLLTELDETRRLLHDAEARLEAQEAADQRKSRLDKLDEAADLKEALPLVTEEVSAAMAPVVERTRARFVLMSQKLAMKEHDDFEQVLEEAGVAEAIELVPTVVDGKKVMRPRDPVMWKKLFEDSDDPGEDAYALAAEILVARGTRVAEPDDKTEVLDEKSGDRAAGRREVLDTVRHNAERPLSIRHVPVSDARERRAYTKADIDKMTDAEYARLPRHIKDQLLGATGDE